MCGFIGFSGNLDNKEAILQKMMDRIVHRGPDMGGMYTCLLYTSSKCQHMAGKAVNGQSQDADIQQRDGQPAERGRHRVALQLALPLRHHPVSYTHLDVYKRQMKRCLREGKHLSRYPPWALDKPSGREATAANLRRQGHAPAIQRGSPGF